jgi:hypothetical protein
MHQNTGASPGDLLGMDASTLALLNNDFDFSTMSDPTWLAMEDNSLTDLHQSITSSTSGSWVNSSLGGSPEQFDPLGTISVSSVLSPNVTLEHADSICSSSGPKRINKQSLVPEAVGTEGLLWGNIENNQAGMEIGEDPFMGWADKRATQTTEEYGWVLSHVGQL